jgi:hypothetical protein
MLKKRNGLKGFLPDTREGGIIKAVMETMSGLGKKAEGIGLSEPVFTLETGNSACSAGFCARISGFEANPVKYTDADGNTPKITLEMQIESTVQVTAFLYQNKDSIKNIGESAAKLAVGLGIASLGVGGGIGIAIGSGGIAALGGVALADAAIVTGDTLVGTGATDILNSIVMIMQSNSDDKHSKNEYREKTRGKQK